MFILLNDYDTTFLNVMEVAVINDLTDFKSGIYNGIKIILKSGYELKLIYKERDVLIRDLVSIKKALKDIIL